MVQKKDFQSAFLLSKISAMNRFTLVFFLYFDSVFVEFLQKITRHRFSMQYNFDGIFADFSFRFLGAQNSIFLAFFRGWIGQNNIYNYTVENNNNKIIKSKRCIKIGRRIECV